MKIIWTNDIHLEFLSDQQLNRFLNSMNCGADAILIAGDIAQARSLQKYLTQMSSIVTAPVYFVLGNHDFYKGSIRETKTDLKQFLQLTPNLHWLSESGVIKLTDKTALVGHEGWADGRFGHYDYSSVELNDFHLIRELKGLNKAMRLYHMQRLAEESAEHFNKVVPEALEVADHVIVVTHIPPWSSAAWYAGRHSDMEYLPFFSSQIAGQTLMGYMEKNPEKRMTVLCGHTHGGGESQILPNLLCLTGESEYNLPRLQEPIEI